MDNIIPILFKGKTHCVAPAQWQFNYGQVLSFDDITLDDPFEIHLANVKVKGFASVHIGTSNQFKIPRAYWVSGLPIYGWIYVHPTSDSGITEYTFVVPVRERAEPDPSEVIPEPEIPVFEELMGLLKNAVSDAQTAQGLAEDAQSAAEASAQAIEDMTVSATTLEPGSSATVTKTIVEGVYHLEYGIPQGAKGDDGRDGADGHSPVITTSKSGTTTTILADGSSIGTVEDGIDGEDGADYILTAQDKQEIANIVLTGLPTWTGGSY